MKKLPLACAISSLLAVAACSPTIDDGEGRIVVENDESTLASRVSYVDSSAVAVAVPVSKAGLAFAPAGGVAALTLVAEVDAPIHEGKTLQATEIRVSGNKAYVSYNFEGATFLGGVEVFDISNRSRPKLISSAIFTDTDVNGLTYSGNKLYLASASNSGDYTSPAILEEIKLKGGKLSDENQIVDLASFAATDVDVAGNYVYVTSGDVGGKITVLNKNDLSQHALVDFEDARSVDSDNQDVAILAGTAGAGEDEAKLLTFDRSLGTSIAEFSFAGTSILHSKATVELKKGKAFMGLSDGGLKVACLADGAELASIAHPDHIALGLDEGKTVTNAVSAYKRSIFMANGEAGVYMAMADSNMNNNDCSIDNLQMIGKLQFDEEQSVNHVVYRGDLLFVAAGAGGLKIIEVDDALAGLDDDDESDDD
jgi:hypothetical protein